MEKLWILFRNKDDKFIESKVLEEVIPYLWKKSIIIWIYNDNVWKSKRQEELVDKLVVNYCLEKNDFEEDTLLTVSNSWWESYNDILTLVNDYVDWNNIEIY